MWVCGTGNRSDKIGIQGICRNDTIQLTGRIREHKYGAILCNQEVGEEHSLQLFSRLQRTRDTERWNMFSG